MSTYTGRTNPNPLAKYRRAETIQRKTRERIDGGKPMSKAQRQAALRALEWPKLWRSFDQHYSHDEADERYRLAWQHYRPPAYECPPETLNLNAMMSKIEGRERRRETAEPKRREPPAAAMITNIQDGFRIATQEQSDAISNLIKLVNMTHFGTAYWRNLSGAHQWPVINHMMTVTDFMLGIMADAHHDRLTDEQQRDLLERMKPVLAAAGQLMTALQKEVSKQEAQTG